MSAQKRQRLHRERKGGAQPLPIQHQSVEVGESVLAVQETQFLLKYKNGLAAVPRPRGKVCNKNRKVCATIRLKPVDSSWRNLLKYLYRAPLIGGPQVAWVLQASWGRSGKQEQEQNSPNLGPAYKWSPVFNKLIFAMLRYWDQLIQASGKHSLQACPCCQYAVPSTSPSLNLILVWLSFTW